MALITFTNGEVERIQDTTSIKEYEDRIEIISGSDERKREYTFYRENVRKLEVEASESVERE